MISQCSVLNVRMRQGMVSGVLARPLRRNMFSVITTSITRQQRSDKVSLPARAVREKEQPTSNIRLAFSFSVSVA